MKLWPYDALMLVSFGGPEAMDEVEPFLDRILAGKNVPRERKLEVMHHYEMFGGVSPINQQNRELCQALATELKRRGIFLPLHWGNRNSKPFIKDALQDIVQAGGQKVLAFVTSAFGSYSGCKQYRENLEAATAEINGAELQLDKIRTFFNHPKFISAQVEQIKKCLFDHGLDTSEVQLLFTAHSIPLAMAKACRYVEELEEAARLVAESLEVDYRLVYQSRSGPPHVPWLGPDVVQFYQEQVQDSDKEWLVVPLGFLSDHMEVLYDLDYELKNAVLSLGKSYYRAKAVSGHPLLVEMVVDLIEERLGLRDAKDAVGRFPASLDQCPPSCCEWRAKP